MSVFTARAKAEKSMLEKRNVVGVGIGYKTTEGTIAGLKPTVVVMVQRKFPLDILEPQDVIPMLTDGYQTDVMEVGHIRALGYTERERPIVPGISVGHYRITAGTFGCVVHDASGFPYMLSNNHVLANTNDAMEGDPIYQPGPIDGGDSEDLVGTLHKFIPIGFGEVPPPEEPECPVADSYVRLGNAVAGLLNRKTRIKQVLPQTGTQEVYENTVDCAIAEFREPNMFSPEIKEIGVPKGIEPESLGLALQKTGRTTGHTVGTIQLINATVRVDYGKEETALFRGQIITDNMSKGGDSGSLVLTRFGDPKAVGLLYAGSSVSTILNPIGSVLSALGVSFER